MPKFEEQIGVKIPGQGHYIVSIAVGPFDTDEEVLSRISTRVGTIFNVTGVKFEVVQSSPFKIKKLVPKREDETEEEPAPPKAKTKPPKPVSDPPPPPSEPPPPPSERRPTVGPQVGERWRPRDPRRVSSFIVAAVEGDHVLTDDGRKIQLARFPRYERVSEAASKVS